MQVQADEDERRFEDLEIFHLNVAMLIFQTINPLRFTTALELDIALNVSSVKMKKEEDRADDNIFRQLRVLCNCCIYFHSHLATTLVELLIINLYSFFLQLRATNVNDLVK